MCAENICKQANLHHNLLGNQIAGAGENIINILIIGIGHLLSVLKVIKVCYRLPHDDVAY